MNQSKELEKFIKKWKAAMRVKLLDLFPTKTYQPNGEREKTRRRKQIERGILKVTK